MISFLLPFVFFLSLSYLCFSATFMHRSQYPQDSYYVQQTHREHFSQLQRLQPIFLVPVLSDMVKKRRKVQLMSERIYASRSNNNGPGSSMKRCYGYNSFDSTSHNNEYTTISSSSKGFFEQELLQQKQNKYQEGIRYNYFAYGSNVLPTTMKSLRNIEPLFSTAAVLPNYNLCFDIPGLSWVEPSAASIERTSSHSSLSSSYSNNHYNMVDGRSDVVHGVVYGLTFSDFKRVEWTEGLSYTWEKCTVYPYVGDNDRAGELALINGLPENCMECYTLVKSKRLHQNQQRAQRARFQRHIPPSLSYLRIIQEGAAVWKMDRAYQIALSKVTTDKNLFLSPFREGLSGTLLNAARILNPK